MSRVSSKEAFSYKLLKALAVGGMVLIAASNPFFGLSLVRGIKKDLERKKWREFYKDLHRLQGQKKIKISKNYRGHYQVTLTDLGRQNIEKYDLDNLAIKKPKKWDGAWRFFSFDIPTHKKIARQVLLAKLKELDFIMVQKSLWAHPFECREELSVIAEAFEVRLYTLSFVAHQIEGKEWLKKEFERKSGIILS